MDKINIKADVQKDLIKSALDARLLSYSPYSGFQVGAALLTASGSIYTGCNIESASYSPTNCAERTAFFKAVSQGEREFVAIAVVGGASDALELDYCPPCGVCRQVMMEFCAGDFQIILAKSLLESRTYDLEALLPMGFGPGDLCKAKD